MTRFWKPALGWLTFLLGSLGVLLCIALLAGTWVLHHRLQTVLSEVSSELVGLGERMEAGANDVSGFLDESREQIRTFDERLTARIQNGLDLSDEDVAGLRDLQVQVSATIDRVKDWVAFAQASVAFVEQLVDVVESTFDFFRADPEGRANLMDALAQGRTDIELTMDLLDEAGARLETLRLHEAAAEAPRVIQTLAEQIDESLRSVQSYADAFAASLRELQVSIESTGKRMARTLLGLAILCTALLAWQAAAQASLGVVGWRARRKTAAQEGAL